MKKTIALLSALFVSTSVFAKLPPPSEEAMAKAEEAKAKAAEAAKAAADQLGRAQDRVVAEYLRQRRGGRGMAVSSPMPAEPSAAAMPKPMAAPAMPPMPAKPATSGMAAEKK